MNVEKNIRRIRRLESNQLEFKIDFETDRELQYHKAKFNDYTC